MCAKPIYIYIGKGIFCRSPSTCYACGDCIMAWFSDPASIIRGTLCGRFHILSESNGSTSAVPDERIDASAVLDRVQL